MISEPLKSGRVFIVDDEPANLKLVQRLFQHHSQLELIAIQDSRQVLPLYKESPPDLILLDLNMPHLSGYDVMNQLRSLKDPMLPPIVILTAQHSSEYLMRSLISGARDFISKPFDHAELLMRVRNLLDAHLAHRLVHEKKAVLEEMVEERTKELRQTQLQMVQRLCMAAEHRDEETGNHILRMSHICKILGLASGMNSEEAELLLHASPMHDIGKIGIPDNILLKPGKLTPEEWKIMQNHTTIGEKLLANDDSPLMSMARDIAYTHHEKWDGSGYPKGIKGTDIPIGGRIAALADVFDALTSERPYKKAWSIDDALGLLKDNRGKHFDPELVDIFMENLPKILEIRDKFSEENSKPAIALVQ